MTGVGSLREMSAAGTNSRSGILPPGSIANKTPGSACRYTASSGDTD